MRIQFENNFIDIAEIGRASSSMPNAGDVNVSVEVNLGEFRGFHKSVWFEGPSLKNFIDDLTRFESQRRGEVALEACSPGEFKLIIRSRDVLGHIVVEISLCQYQYSGPTYWPTTIAGGFEVDPTHLPMILRDFKGLHIGANDH